MAEVMVIDYLECFSSLAGGKSCSSVLAVIKIFIIFELKSSQFQSVNEMWNSFFL